MTDPSSKKVKETGAENSCNEKEAESEATGENGAEGDLGGGADIQQNDKAEREPTEWKLRPYKGYTNLARQLSCKT